MSRRDLPSVIMGVVEPTLSPLLTNARQLAEGMWTATLVLDRDGALVFYNEGAEVLVGRPFADCGPMPASEWGGVFNIRARDGSPFPLETMPGWIHMLHRRPAMGHVRLTSLDGIERFLSVAAFPLFTEVGEFEGALAHFWEEETLPGERLIATVLFCDLRGHTADAAQLEPARVKELLDVFYEHVARLINRLGGTLMAFTGDEVFAAWGAPTPDELGPDRAVACARLLQETVPALNGKLRARSLPESAFGIGIHTGEVVDAHVGFGPLRHYTVTGDTVNCASRLCSIAGRNEIVVSAETFGQLTEKPPVEVSPGIPLKGVGRELLPHRLWPDDLKDPTGEQRQGKVDLPFHPPAEREDNQNR